MTRSSLRVGLLGSTGRWGSKIARVLKPRCNLIPCPTRLLMNEMLADPRIDAVVIATPMETHAALAEVAIRAGKHVFVEKPMAMDAESAERLMCLADAEDKVLFVGHVFVHHPVFARLKELVGREEILSLRFVWRKFGTFDSNMILNLASHEISLAIALCPEGPILSEVLHRSGLITQMDVFIARMLIGGTECLIDLDRCSPGSASKIVTIKLKRSGDIYIWNGPWLFELSQSGTERLIFDSDEEPLGREMDAFLAACSGELPPTTDGHHGFKVMQVVSAMIGRSGTP